MPLNIIELMDSVIRDAQSLLAELEQDDKARHRIDTLLNAAQFIRNELNLIMSSDGSISQTVIASGRYAGAPFAIFETNIYLTKKLTSSGTIVLSAAQLEQLEQMKTKVALVKEQLDEIWGT